MRAMLSLVHFLCVKAMYENWNKHFVTQTRYKLNASFLATFTSTINNKVGRKELIELWTLLDISVGILENSAWKESSIPPAGRFGNELSDSSSSEAEKELGGVHFVVGDGPEEPAAGKIGVPYKEKSGITRSYSQDTNVLSEDKTSSSFLPKTSYSENSLDISDRSYRPALTTTITTTTTPTTTTVTTTKKPFRELSTIMSIDDETLSTDSNSTADNDELKRRRRKLHFPAFRKNKTKVT